MTAPVCFAAGFLFDAVEADFKTNCVDAPMFFGWREVAKHKRTAWRIVWIPGDDANKLGEVTSPRQPGQNPRTLGTLNELMTVRIEAYDGQNPESERFQYRAARGLYDLWYAAVYRASHGKFQILSQEWDVSKKERRFGATIVAVLSVEATLPDVTHDVAPPDVQADVNTILEDVDEPTVEPVP